MDDDLLAQVRDAAATVFSNTAIFLAYAFGSRISGGSAEASDLDIGYYLRLGGSGALPLAEEMALADRLSLRVHFEVDLRNLGPAPLEVRGRILETGARIYCSDDAERVRLEAGLLSRYLDYKPELEAFHALRLRSIAKRG